MNEPETVAYFPLTHHLKAREVLVFDSLVMTEMGEKEDF